MILSFYVAMNLYLVYQRTAIVLSLHCLICSSNVKCLLAPIVSTRAGQKSLICRSAESEHSTAPKAEKEKLKFIVSINATSDPLEGVTVDEIGRFLSTTTCRDVFLSAGGKTQCMEEPMTSEFAQLWEAECQSHYGSNMLLESGDSLVQSESTVQFPGLKMVNIVYSGVKARSKDNLPYYDIILVGERRRVFGASPIVWLFNKLTGHTSEKEDALRPPSARVQSVISVKDGDFGPFFSFDCNVEIVVEFPKAVIKFSPFSKEKMEEQGTASVRKAIEKDVLDALNSVNKVYLNWSAS